MAHIPLAETKVCLLSLLVANPLPLAIGETVTVMLLSLSCLLSRYCHATVIYCHLLLLLLLW